MRFFGNVFGVALVHACICNLRPVSLHRTQCFIFIVDRISLNQIGVKLMLVTMLFAYSKCYKRQLKESFSAVDMLISVIAGGIAGTSVDLVLFPVDTLKTRLQASTTQLDMT